MCHGIEKVFNLAMGTFSKSENFKQKFEKLLVQTSQLTGRDAILNVFYCIYKEVKLFLPSKLNIFYHIFLQSFKTRISAQK